MTGSKGMTHWTSETVCECSEIAGSPQGSPPAADYVGYKAGRRTCSEHETGTEELCETVFRIRIRIEFVSWIRIRIPNAYPDPDPAADNISSKSQNNSYHLELFD